VDSNVRAINPSFREIILFLIVGGVSTVVNYLVFLLSFKIAGIWYLISSWIGYFAGVLFGYLLNSIYTFNAGSQISGKNIASYLGIYLLSLLIGTVLLYAFVEFGKITPLISNILVICQTTVTNYLGCKFFVFRKK
jgi:putative flippase GtrA